MLNKPTLRQSRAGTGSIRVIGALIRKLKGPPKNYGRGDLPEVHVTRSGGFYMKGKELAQSDTWRNNFKRMVETNLARDKRRKPSTKRSLNRRSRYGSRPRRGG